MQTMDKQTQKYKQEAGQDGGFIIKCYKSDSL